MSTGTSTLRQWEPEHFVSAGQARALVAAQFPDLPLRTVAPFGAGWDNTAYLIDGRLVFRFPRREIAAECMAHEILMLPPIAGVLPLPVSAATHVGAPGDAFPWPFAGYPLLPGRPASDVGLDDAARTRAAAPLGRFLAALHGLPTAPLVAAGAPGDLIGRLHLVTRIPRTRANLAEIARRTDLDVAASLAVVADVEADPPAGGRAAAVVHGDLDARHVLVDDGGAPCGVIDWGDVHLGDPAGDLMLALGFLPPTAHPAFRAAYGAVHDDAWRLARFRAVNHASVIVVYGLETGADALVREGLTSLRHAGASPGGP